MSSSQKEHLLPKDGRPTGHLRRMSSHSGSIGGGSGGNGINIVDSAAPYTPTPPVEKVDSPRSKYQWLAIYFALNLALTLYNKAVMGKVSSVCCSQFKKSLLPGFSCTYLSYGSDSNIFVMAH